MRTISGAVLAISVLAWAQGAAAQSYQMPKDSDRCPSRWGKDDQRGSANWMKPETVVRAAQLIKTGQVFELGAVLSSDPKEAFLNENRVFNIYTKPTEVIPNARTSHEELVVGEIGQIGTQIDALSHQMWGGAFYNCLQFKDIGSRYGFKALGADKIGGLMARAVLLDIAGLKSVPMLANSYVITPEDLEQALSRQKLKLQPGDVILLRTGWSVLMGKDNARYGRQNPGVGIEGGRWLAKQDPMLVGADTCCVEVRPSEPGLSLPVHSLMIIEKGILLLENLMLEEMAKAGAHEAAFIVQPLKIKGGTGSAVAPMAIR